MMNEEKSNRDLQEHMLWTYYGLRVGLALIGIFLPVVVYFAGGVLHHVWLEGSISAYYHTPPSQVWFTTRDLFVGGLLAASACLYLNKGYSNKENIALNLAAIFAVFVALLPTAPRGEPTGLISILHGTSAVLFFLCIAYVSLRRSGDTLELLEPTERPRYEQLYKATGGAMIASPVLAVVLSWALDPDSPSRTTVFWIETLGIWSFAAYWIIKTGEMRKSSAERKGLDAELKRESVLVTEDAPSAYLHPKMTAPYRKERIVSTG